MVAICDCGVRNVPQPESDSDQRQPGVGGLFKSDHHKLKLNKEQRGLSKLFTNLNIFLTYLCKIIEYKCENTFNSY